MVVFGFKESKSKSPVSGVLSALAVFRGSFAKL